MGILEDGRHQNMREEPILARFTYGLLARIIL